MYFVLRSTDANMPDERNLQLSVEEAEEITRGRLQEILKKYAATVGEESEIKWWFLKECHLRRLPPKGSHDGPYEICVECKIILCSAW